MRNHLELAILILARRSICRRHAGSPPPVLLRLSTYPNAPISDGTFGVTAHQTVGSIAILGIVQDSASLLINFLLLRSRSTRHETAGNPLPPGNTTFSKQYSFILSGIIAESDCPG